MKQRLLLSVCFILLLTITVVVSAEISQTFEGNYNVKVYLEKGWNLVYGVPLLQEGYPLQEGSTLNKEDIKAIFWYNPFEVKYVQIYPGQFEGLPELKVRYAYISGSASWVYSEKEGYFVYSQVDSIKLQDKKLKEGWNFLGISPDMEWKTVSEVKGNCTIEKAYLWDSATSSWDDNLLKGSEKKFEKNTIVEPGRGFAVKVSENCNLGTSGSSVSPPELRTSTNPSEGSEKYCKDEDGSNQAVRGSAITEPQGDNRPIAHADSCVAVSDKNNYIAFVDGTYYTSSSKDCPTRGNCYAADGGNCNGTGCFLAESICEGTAQKYKIFECSQCDKGVCIK